MNEEIKMSEDITMNIEIKEGKHNYNVTLPLLDYKIFEKYIKVWTHQREPIVFEIEGIKSEPAKTVTRNESTTGEVKDERISAIKKICYYEKKLPNETDVDYAIRINKLVNIGYEKLLPEVPK